MDNTLKSGLNSHNLRSLDTMASSEQVCVQWGFTEPLHNLDHCGWWSSALEHGWGQGSLVNRFWQSFVFPLYCQVVFCLKGVNVIWKFVSCRACVVYLLLLMQWYTTLQRVREKIIIITNLHKQINFEWEHEQHSFILLSICESVYTTWN
jgi:hypothetical protein